MATKLGEEIRLFRKKHGYPLEDFAHKVGCSRSYMSMIERGMDPRGNIPSPNTEILKNLSQVMNIPLDVIIKMSEEPYYGSSNLHDNLKFDLVSDGSCRLKARNGEIVYSGEPNERFITNENRARQKELASLNVFVNKLEVDEIQKLHQIAEIMFKKTKSGATEQLKSPDDYNLKKKHFREIFGFDQTVLAIIECLEGTDEDEYKSILDSCDRVWQIGNDKSEAVTMYYSKMVQSMKDEIIRKAVAKLAKNHGK